MAKKVVSSVLVNDTLQGKTKDDKAFQRVQESRAGGSRNRRRIDNAKEDALVKAIDMKDNVEKLALHIEKLAQGKTDVNGFFANVSKYGAMELAQIALDPHEQKKIKLTAITELLDRAGHGKIQKSMVLGSIDSSASKEELMAAIMGAASKNDDIEIEIDDEEEE